MKTGWMWIPSWDEQAEDNEEKIVLFRNEWELADAKENIIVRLTADTRYKLYINGELTCLGPLKGDTHRWFQDEIDLGKFLKPGHNILSVEVLRLPTTLSKGNFSLFRTERPGFYFECEHTPAGLGEWRCIRKEKIRFVSENPYFAPLQIFEKACGDAKLTSWMTTSYDDDEWEEAERIPEKELPAICRPEKLQKRDIPFMRLKPGKLHHLTPKAIKGQPSSDGGDRRLSVEANQKAELVLDAGELMCGFLRLSFAGGKGASVNIVQAECFVESVPHTITSYDDLPVKGDRSDSQNGIIQGYADRYIVAGAGSADLPELYEPFWFRTFRYIKLVIETGEQPLEIGSVTFLETGYPLEVHKEPEIKDPVMHQIWDISLRTLKRCMHETYMDCPYYEQLQYLMDSRVQMLFTYEISGDDRLAKHALEDFRLSQLENGMLNACYPSTRESVIPGFSIYFIAMLHDHMRYFGDAALLSEYIGTVFRILDFFLIHKTSTGLVGKIGGLNRPGQYWSFIDWTPQWHETNGVPQAILEGAITMESLLYLYGLRLAEDILAFLRKETSKLPVARQHQYRHKQMEYKKEAEIIIHAVNKHCRNADGVYLDGPGIDRFSQHCQVFAVLTDAVSPEEGKKILERSLDDRSQFAQCSVAMQFYLFRALEKCGIYERTALQWNIWKEMIQKHMTTCGEDQLSCRSDCHAWGALALYEFPAVLYK